MVDGRRCKGRGGPAQDGVRCLGDPSLDLGKSCSDFQFGPFRGILTIRGQPTLPSHGFGHLAPGPVSLPVEIRTAEDLRSDTMPASLEPGPAIRLTASGCLVTVGPDRTSGVCAPSGLPSGPHLDELIASIGIARTLLEGGLVMHASAVVGRDGCLLFAARSGTGKSTLARLLAPERILADDQVVLLPEGTAWQCCDARFGTGAAARVADLFFPERAAATEAVPLSTAEAVRMVLRNAVLWPAARSVHALLLEHAERLARGVSCRTLRFSLDDVCARIRVA